MNEHADKGGERAGRWQPVIGLLCSPKAGGFIPKLFFAVLLLTAVSRTAMTFLLPDTWQISGYYLDAQFYSLLLIIGAAWVFSIVVLLVRKDYRRGLGRMVAIPALLFLGLIVSAMTTLLLPQRRRAASRRGSRGTPDRRDPDRLEATPHPIRAILRSKPPTTVAAKNGSY